MRKDQLQQQLLISSQNCRLDSSCQKMSSVCRIGRTSKILFSCGICEASRNGYWIDLFTPEISASVQVLNSRILQLICFLPGFPVLLHVSAIAGAFGLLYLFCCASVQMDTRNTFTCVCGLLRWNCWQSNDIWLEQHAYRAALVRRLCCHCRSSLQKCGKCTDQNTYLMWYMMLRSLFIAISLLTTVRLFWGSFKRARCGFLIGSY